MKRRSWRSLEKLRSQWFRQKLNTLTELLKKLLKSKSVEEEKKRMTVFQNSNSVTYGTKCWPCLLMVSLMNAFLKTDSFNWCKITRMQQEFMQFMHSRQLIMHHIILNIKKDITMDLLPWNLVSEDIPMKEDKRLAQSFHLTQVTHMEIITVHSTHLSTIDENENSTCKMELLIIIII